MSDAFDQAVRGRAQHANVQLTDVQIAALGNYYELLSRWTQTINLTSLPLEGHPDQSIDRLIVEPLLAATFFPAGSPRWIDLGTGSGSPAIPLRIVRPAGSLAMVESRERKTAFLREVVRTLELERTEVRTSRIEEVAASAPAGWADLITMRAVKPTFTIVHAAAHLLKAGGRFLVFGSRSGGVGTAEVGSERFQLSDTAPLLELGHRLYVLTRR